MSNNLTVAGYLSFNFRNLSGRLVLGGVAAGVAVAVGLSFDSTMGDGLAELDLSVCGLFANFEKSQPKTAMEKTTINMITGSFTISPRNLRKLMVNYGALLIYQFMNLLEFRQ